jgi:gp32 DNA binding protein like
MALTFGNTKGKAQKNTAEAYTYVDNENTVRIFGGILPRYVYWVKGIGGKPIPMECLAFSRAKEKFDNLEVDHVPEYFPELKCSWAYSINCIDPKDGKAKVLNLKKKLFSQIMTAAEDLGDPTDPEEGWDIVFKKTKTGSNAFDVEYTLSVLRCKKRKLTEAELEIIEKEPDIDTKIPRAKAEEQKALLEKITKGQEEEEEEQTPAEKEAAKDL